MSRRTAIAAAEAAATAAPQEPVPPPEPVRLNWRQVRSSLAQLKDELCYAYHPTWGYKSVSGSYIGTLTNTADPVLKATAHDFLESFAYSPTLCELVNQDMARRIAALPAKTCDFALDLPEIEPLIKLMPGHPTYRALLSSKVLQSPPDELTTYESIRDWVETTYQPADDIRASQPPSAARPAPARRNLFRIEFGLSDTAYGTCSYRENRSGSADAMFSMADISDHLDDHDNVDDLFDALREAGEEDIWSEADMEGDGDIDYDNYDESGTEDGNVELATSRSHCIDQLRAFILQNATREQLEQLGLD